MLTKYQSKIEERFAAGNLSCDYENYDFKELREEPTTRQFWSTIELMTKYLVLFSEVEMDEDMAIYTYQKQEIITDELEIDIMEEFKLGEELKRIFKDNLIDGRIQGLKEISGYEEIEYEFEYNINNVNLVALFEMKEGQPINFIVVPYKL